MVIRSNPAQPGLRLPAGLIIRTNPTQSGQFLTEGFLLHRRADATSHCKAELCHLSLTRLRRVFFRLSDKLRGQETVFFFEEFGELLWREPHAVCDIRDIQVALLYHF